MTSRRAEAWLVVAIFVAATIVWTWPLARHPASAYAIHLADPNTLQRADMSLTTWMLAWSGHALRTSPLHLFDANIFHPLPKTLAFSESLVASALLVLPVDLAFGNPVLDHNVLVVATFVLGGVGTTLLLRELGCSLVPALAAGAVFVFNAFRWGTLTHVQVLSSQWMPWTLLALHRLFATGRRRTALAFAAGMTAVALSSVYYLYFFGAAVGAVLVLAWALRGPAAPGSRRRAWLGLAAAAAVMGVVMVPYLQARAMYTLERTWNQAGVFSLPALVFFGGLLDPAATPYAGKTVVGVGGLLLGLVGLAGRARPEHGGRRAVVLYLAVALVGVFITLGPTMKLYSAWAPGAPGPWRLLSTLVPGWDALRVPARGATVALLGIAVLVGFGADALLRLARRPAARAVVTLVVLAVVLDEAWRPAVYPIPVPWQGEPPAVDRWLATQPGTFAIVDLPLGTPDGDAQAMVLSAYHWKRLVNGYSGFTPTSRYFRRLCLGFPSDESLRVLTAIGVRMAVIHKPEALPAHQRLCTAPLPPTLVRLYDDPAACVVGITGAPPAPPLPPDAPVSLAGAHLVTSGGDDARAVVDGDLATHWVQTVVRQTPGWLEIDLPEEHAIARVVVRLGPHFGEFLREYELLASQDGTTWTRLAKDDLPRPPVVDIQTRPQDLRTEIVVPAAGVTPARRFRLVRPAQSDPSDFFDLWPGWPVWGVHELELYERR
jgi:F5/8 type C domain-containing protein